jgi:hypothetical protein
MGKPFGKLPLGRLRRRWGNSVRMDLREIGCEHATSIELVQNCDK